jgi:hypothetical protein
MGGSSSKVKSSIANNTLNMTDIENTTKSIQESATSTLIKNASSCSSSVNQNNTCNMSGTKVTGGFTFGGKQSNKASVNFSCVQAKSAAATMTDSMASSIANELGVLNGSEAAAKMNAAAEAKTTSGAGSWGSGSSSSKTDTSVTNNVTNSTKSVVENIFKKSLSNNFNSETVNECMGRTTQSNEVNLSNMNIEGGAKVDCDQSNTLEQVQECKQLNEAINKTLSETAQELGFKIDNTNKTASTTESTSKATTETVSTGPIQDLGNAIGGILGLASLGVAGPFIVYACCICCCIILSVVSSMFVIKSGGGSASISTPSGFNMHVGLPKRGRKGFRGGNSDTDSSSSDVIGYLGAVGVDIFSDIISDSSL